MSKESLYTASKGVQPQLKKLMEDLFFRDETRNAKAGCAKFVAIQYFPEEEVQLGLMKGHFSTRAGVSSVTQALQCGKDKVGVCFHPKGCVEPTHVCTPEKANSKLWNMKAEEADSIGCRWCTTPKPFRKGGRSPCTTHAILSLRTWLSTSGKPTRTAHWRIARVDVERSVQGYSRRSPEC